MVCNMKNILSELSILMTFCYLSITTTRETCQQEGFWTIGQKGNCKETLPIQKVKGLNEVRVNLENNHNWVYAGVIEIGNPPQKMRIEFDTGSADMWVMSSAICEQDPKFCEGHYSYNSVNSKTYVKDGRLTELQYGTGIVRGFISQDDVVINGIKIEGQTFLEVIAKKYSFNETKYPDIKDGIIGLGFPAMSVILNITKTPTPLCNLVNLGLIKRPMFSFYLNKVEPSSDTGQGTGELVLGGYNPDHFIGEIVYAPVLEDASNWIIKVDRIMLGGDEIGKDVAAMIDSGTSGVVGPEEMIGPIKKLVFGDNYKTKKSNTVNCSIINSESLPDLTFVIKGVKFVLTPEDYIVKEYDSKRCLCGFSQLHMDNESRVLIVGNVFMRKVYTVFDIGNMQIGFATAK